jgi:ATP-dependent RNA helicase RhlE
VADIEKLIKTKIELQAIAFDEDPIRPRNRQRSSDASRRADDAVPAAGRTWRAPAAQQVPTAPPRDPFFEQPYASTTAAATPENLPLWETPAGKPGPRGVSANIKPKRRVAALLKALD